MRLPRRVNSHAADRVALADLEARDGLARLGHDRLLAGNLWSCRKRRIQDLLVADRLTDPHVEGDLGDARDLHDRLVAELREEPGTTFSL